MNVLAYKNIILTSDEILSVNLEKSIQINATDTILLYEVTQIGILKANRFSVSAEIRNDTHNKFLDWHDILNTKPTENLNVFSVDWGNYFLEKTNFSVNSLSPDGTILQMKMDLSFIEFVNFS
jgi:hypothetical protein